MKYGSLYERLVANSVKPDDQNENGCWLWTGNVDDDGYGRLTLRAAGKHKKVRAHRAMEDILRVNQAQLDLDDANPSDDPFACLPTIELFMPLCPENNTIDHLCWSTGCSNPDHWQVVTRAKNSALSQQRNPRWPLKAISEPS